MKRRRLPRLKVEVAGDPDARWMIIDEFLRMTAELRPIRARLAKLLEELRGIADYGLAEQIEETVNELGGEQLDRAVKWAFEQGRVAGRREARMS